MDILRFITAGNVDDGKSTLIGRLLYDTNNIKADVLESVTNETLGASVVHAAGGINLAHITDGLRAERDQGITIDVAYKYFTTKHRKYIITDAPGHFQYTRNLVTGASNTDLVIILIDARNGITQQTRRHSLAASFLKIGQVVVAVNKMDAVNCDEQVFNEIKAEYMAIAAQLQLPGVSFIPISALLGDNVTFHSDKMEWYAGRTLLQYLEECQPAQVNPDLARFSVQLVIANGAEKMYAGKVLSGLFKVNDRIVCWPAGNQYVITKVISGFTEVQQASQGQNLSLCLKGSPEIVRGNVLSGIAEVPVCGRQLTVNICWLDAASPLETGKAYYLRINAMETDCKVVEVVCKTDVNTFEQYSDEKPVTVNGFARVRIETMDEISYDLFSTLPANGRGIIIDPATNYTSGVFTIVS